jgi:hypothetical protein
MELELGGVIEAWHTELDDSGREVIVVDRFRHTEVSMIDPRQQHKGDPRQAHDGRKESKPL